jgi:hypothetical protein
VQHVSSPRWWSQFAARLRRGTLDAALADGADPSASPALAVRAAALTAAGSRRDLAQRLDRLGSPGQPPSRMRLAPPRRSVAANAPALWELAALLRAPAPLRARGLAMLTRLLTDGAGPLYRHGEAAALADALSSARAALSA